MTGFKITCLRCGAEMVIKPGVRSVEAEPVRIEWDDFSESQYVGCNCGNAIASDAVFDKHIWSDRSEKRRADESTVYGVDCRGGRCEF